MGMVFHWRQGRKKALSLLLPLVLPLVLALRLVLEGRVLALGGLVGPL